MSPIRSFIASTFIVAALSCSAAALADRPRGVVQGVENVAVALRPATTLRGQRANLTVRGAMRGPVAVRMVGATRDLGRPLGWIQLHRHGRSWRATLPAPELRGIYPLELRIAGNRQINQMQPLRLRVFTNDTAHLPTFARAEEAARWWLSTRARGARLVAIKLWPSPAFDGRDPRLHQLMVIAYEPTAGTGPRDQLGMFITAVREKPGARWRFLEATVQP